MSFAAIARNRNSERLVALLSAIAVLMSMMVLFASPAQAHHPTTTAGQQCVNGEVVISYTSTSWQLGEPGHPDVRIEVSVDDGSWVEVGSGEYSQANGYTFSGTFPGEDYWGQSIRVRSQVVGNWPNGAATGNSNPAATTAPFTVTQDCFNPSCPSGYLEFKLEPVSSGTFGPNDEFTITVGSTADGQVFDWSSTVPVYQVIVKGGPGANVENYDGAFGDTGLHAPVNPSNGLYHGLSHISFCYQEVQDQPVRVQVDGGVCLLDGGLPAGSASITIDPDSQATVDIYRDAAMTDLVTSVSASGTVDDLSPGTYHWSATAASGYELQGPSSGQFTIEPCEVSVSVAAGVCVAGGQGAAGTAQVTIDPDAQATVSIHGDAGMTNLVTTVSASGVVNGLAPGTYYWDAIPADGFDLGGPDEGQFTIDPCEVSVEVGGLCVLEGDRGTGEVSVNVSVANGVTVEVADSGGAVVATLTQSGTVTVPEGAGYSWSATAAPGFTITGPTSGDIDIDECTRTLELAVDGVCDANIPVLTWAVTPVDFSAGEVTITWNDIAPSDPLHSSVQPLSGSMVWPGTVLENGEAVDWAGWLLVDGAWVQGSDGYENTRPFASVTFSVNPSMTIDVEYPGGEPTCDGPPAEIIVEKVVDGGSQQVEFTFDTTNFSLADNTLAHGEASSSGPLLPGDGYSVSEDVPPFWVLASAVCDDGSSPANIDLSVGEVVTCTFTNQVEDLVLASIQVTVAGSCELDGDEGEGVVEITMSVPNGADVVIRDSDGDFVDSLSSDGTITVPEGASYTWEVFPNEGFEFPPGFDSSGTITIESCSNPETLPFTGVDSDRLVTFGIIMLLAGVLVVVAGGWNRYRPEEK